MLPSSAELHYFLEVANTQNLSRASERIGISQPSLSLAIKRLEQAVGIPLFFRHKHGMSLTQAGRQLLIHTKHLIQSWENTKSEALASQEMIQGQFKLGCHSTVAIHTLSKLLAPLLATHPHLDLNLHHDISRKITEGVINLSIDIGLVINPIHHPNLVITKLCEDEVTFWVGKGERIIQNIHSNEAVILCEPDLTQTQALLKRGKKMGLHPKRIVTMNSLEVVASLTAAGCGIGILPSRVANSLYPRQLKRLKKTPIYLDEMCLIYRHENRSVKAIQTILSSIKNHFKPSTTL